MINYSIVMHGNPRDPEASKKAYGNAQYSTVMELEDFSEHIATHGSVYSRADISAILTLAVDCMREQLLAGQRIQLGDLGTFYISLNSEGALTAAEYNPLIHVKKVKVNWTPGRRFQDLLSDAEFNLVPTREAARRVVKALKAGDTTVDLSKPSVEEDSGSDLEG